MKNLKAKISILIFTLATAANSSTFANSPHSHGSDDDSEKSPEMQLTEMPMGCLVEKKACAIKATHAIFKSSSFYPNVNLALYKEAALFKDASGYVFVLSGTVNAMSQKEVQLRSVFTDIKFKGEVYIKSEKDRVFIRNTSGEARLTLRDHSELLLPEGFEVWVAGLDQNKRSQHEVIRKIDLRDHLALWSQIFVGSKEEFIKAVENFKSQWQLWQEQEATLYRQIASQAQALTEKKEAQQKQQIQDTQQDKLRQKQSFYQRSFSR